MYKLSKFKALFSAYLKNALIYRSMIVVYMFEAFFLPLIMLFVWQTIIASNGHLESSQQSIINFYILIPVVSILVSSWHGFFLAQDIRLGMLNAYLVKPVWPFAPRLCNNFAEKLIKIIYIIPFLAISLSLFRVKIQLSISAWIIFITALLLSTLLWFLIETLIGLSAFWSDENSSFREAVQIFHATLGGVITPTFLFPGVLRKIAVVLPFRYMTSWPVEILSGKTDAKILIEGFTWQLIWIILLLFTVIFLWKKGVKKYSAIGG